MKTKLLVILFVTLAGLAARGQQFQVLHHFVQSLRAPVADLLEGGDGVFYGTAGGGGPHDKGAIFKTDTSGNVTIIHLFVGPDGAEPSGQLIRGNDGKFYGTTYGGGAADKGTVFVVDNVGTVTTLHSFSGPDGNNPKAGLTKGSDGMLYGTTLYGGAGFNGSPFSGSGTIFKIDSAGQFALLHSFTGSNGGLPIGGLIQSADGDFYGTTFSGGTSFSGTVFKMDANGIVTTLHHFTGAPSDGSTPTAGLKEGSDGSFYGTTQFGGANDSGTVFKIDAIGNPYSVLYSFAGGFEGGTAGGGLPQAGLIEGSDGDFYGTTLVGGTNGRGTVFKINPSGSLTTLHSFQPPLEGALPSAGVVEAADGNFFGVTGSGGPSNHGTIYKLTPSGTFTTLHSFSGEGTQPTAPLVQASDGNLYGVTTTGGVTDGGTIFKIDAAVHVTTLHSFIGSDGRFAANEQLMDGTLIEGSDGNLYGATWAGGSDDRGTLFKMDLSGNLTTLHSFTGPTPDLPVGDPTDGAYPGGALVEDSDGNFYGTTTLGGAATVGTAFKMDPSGNVTTLHSFVGYVAGGMGNPPDGSVPSGALIRGSDGKSYGTTILGGINTVFGTVFKMDSLGVVTIVHSFLGHTDTSLDGSFPEAGVVEGSDGQFYGTTVGGGTNDSGIVFKVDSLGNYMLVHSFVNTDGSRPQSELIQGSDGNLYGTTSYGGPDARERFPLDGHGTVFKIDPSGALTTLHSFSGTDGADPRARLFEANDGNLYGTTNSGGSSGAGVVFRIVIAPAPLNVVSRKTHGERGTFDINLSLTGNPGIECRTGGAARNYRMIVTFPSAVTCNNAQVTGGTGSVSNFSVNASGTKVTVNLTGVSNAQTITVTLIGVNDGNNTGDVAVRMGVLLGDTTANGSVNSSDIAQTKSKSGQAVTSTNFRQDVTINGSINSSDISLVKSKSGTALP